MAVVAYIHSSLESVVLGAQTQPVVLDSKPRFAADRSTKGQTMGRAGVVANRHRLVETERTVPAVGVRLVPCVGAVIGVRTERFACIDRRPFDIAAESLHPEIGVVRECHGIRHRTVPFLVQAEVRQGGIKDDMAGVRHLHAAHHVDAAPFQTFGSQRMAVHVEDGVSQSQTSAVAAMADCRVAGERDLRIVELQSAGAAPTVEVADCAESPVAVAANIDRLLERRIFRGVVYGQRRAVRDDHARTAGPIGLVLVITGVDLSRLPGSGDDERTFLNHKLSFKRRHGVRRL